MGNQIHLIINCSSPTSPSSEERAARSGCDTTVHLADYARKVIFCSFYNFKQTYLRCLKLDNITQALRESEFPQRSGGNSFSSIPTFQSKNPDGLPKGFFAKSVDYFLMLQKPLYHKKKYYSANIRYFRMRLPQVNFDGKELVLPQYICVIVYV